MTDQPADVQFGRPFVLVRDTDVSGVSGTGIVANDIQWPDGHAAIHWTGSQYPTTTPHSGGMESVSAVHGHGGATRVVWEPSAIPQAEYGSVWPELVGWVQAAHEDAEQIDPAQLLEYLRELKGRAVAPVRQWMAGVRDAARQATGQQPTCGCGEPGTPGTIHRPGAPCYVDERPAEQPQDHPAAELYVLLRKTGEDRDTAQQLIYAHAAMAVRQHKALNGDTSPAVEQPAEARPAAKALETLAFDLATASKQLLPSDVRAAIEAHRTEILYELAGDAAENEGYITVQELRHMAEDSAR